MKDVPTKSESIPRRPIVLRQPGQNGDDTTVIHTEEEKPVNLLETAATPPQPPAESPSEIQRLRAELDACHRGLEEWSHAEMNWKQERRLFQMMTENVSDLLTLVNAQGNRIWANTTYLHILGYEAEELMGTYVLAEIHPDDQPRATEALSLATTKNELSSVEYRIQQKDGTWLNFHTRIFPIADAAGKLESALLVSSNQTEEKQLAEALSVASTETAAAGMVEAMARDFDQILTNVVGNLTIAKNLNGPHNAIAVRLNEIERSLQRARDLIEQMFSITPQSGVAKVRVHLEAAVQEAVSPVLRGTMVRAEYLFPRNLPEIDIDQEGFSHAIRNIVANCVQAMDKGVVRFSAENIPYDQFSYRPDLPLKAGDYICLHVQDQGHGITEKALPRVFEPYFTTRNGSQGLGLTTALAAVQRMGGTILLDSTPGVGTTVSVYLPTAQGAAPDDAPVGAASPSRTGALAAPSRTGALAAPSRTGTLAAPSRTGSLAPPSRTGNLPPPSRTGAVGLPSRSGTVSLPQPGHKKRILLMDDEQMILDIVSRMLGHLGYDVTTCTDGSQAIAAFAKSKSQSEPFDVVMMDLIIPNGVGGQDAVHTIKKIDPSARVIASSGHLDHPVMLDHRKFGFNAVLEKPYKLEKLQQVIETVISSS